MNSIFIYLTIHLAHCAPPTHPFLNFLKIFLHAIFFFPVYYKEQIRLHIVHWEKLPKKIKL